MPATRTHVLLLDLSEVLVYGLVGAEVELASRLGLPVERVEEALLSEAAWPDALFIGQLAEEQWIEDLLATTGWDLSAGDVQDIVRRNFAREVDGTLAVLADVDPSQRLVLLSDHAQEWADHIRATHPFLERFERLFFSCETGFTKRDPAAFVHVLTELRVRPEQCLFIDDSVRNVETARAAGIPAVQFTDAASLRSELLARGMLRAAVPATSARAQRRISPLTVAGRGGTIRATRPPAGCHDQSMVSMVPRRVGLACLWVALLVTPGLFGCALIGGDRRSAEDQARAMRALAAELGPQMKQLGAADTADGLFGDCMEPPPGEYASSYVVRLLLRPPGATADVSWEDLRRRLQDLLDRTAHSDVRVRLHPEAFASRNGSMVVERVPSKCVVMDAELSKELAGGVHDQFVLRQS